MKALLKFWTNHPYILKPICWLFGHRWEDLYDGQRTYRGWQFCQRCIEIRKNKH